MPTLCGMIEREEKAAACRSRAAVAIFVAIFIAVFVFHIANLRIFK